MNDNLNEKSIQNALVFCYLPDLKDYQNIWDRQIGKIPKQMAVELFKNSCRWYLQIIKVFFVFFQFYINFVNFILNMIFPIMTLTILNYYIVRVLHKSPDIRRHTSTETGIVFPFEQLNFKINFFKVHSKISFCFALIICE